MVNEIEIKDIKFEQLINVSRRINVIETFYYKGYFLDYDSIEKIFTISDRKLGIIKIPFNELLRIEIIERIL
jgi:hypothetical protein